MTQHCHNRILLALIITGLLTITISACSARIPLTREQAFSDVFQDIQNENSIAGQHYRTGDYLKAIKHWYKVINLANQFNRDFTIQQGLNPSFLNDLSGAYCHIGDANAGRAEANGGNITMYKDALQSYLLCLQYGPENITTYDRAIRVAGILNDVDRTTRLKEWKAATKRIKSEYQLRANKIDAAYPSRSTDNMPRNIAFLHLYEWASKTAADAGVMVLVDRYQRSLERYKKITARE